MLQKSLLILALLSATIGYGENGFMPNRGQVANSDSEPVDSIDLKLTLPGTNAYFTPGGVMYHFYRSEEKSPNELTPKEQEYKERGDFNRVGEKVYFFRMDFRLLGYNPNAELVLDGQTRYYENYYLAHCSEGITNVPSFTKATYSDIYPNIDLVYKFEEGRLKYEFHVRPGGNIDDIRFTYVGADDIKASEYGLMVENGFSPLREDRPYTFYEGSEEEIASAFKVENGVVMFDVDAKTSTEKIIIDPTVLWSTYQTNGAGSSDFHANAAFDSNGNLFTAYSTYSDFWPTVNAGAGQYYDGTADGITDIAIMRYNADLSKQWATYYGGDEGDYLCGTGGDYGKTIDVDDNDFVYLAGYANSNPTVFPTQSSGAAGAWYQDDSNLKGGDNPFVIKFDGNGVRQWGTLYQHTDASTSGCGLSMNGIKCQGTKVYFTGESSQFSGIDIPFVTLSGAYNNTTYVGGSDVVLGRFSDDCVLEWSTYFNGGNPALTGWKDGADLTFDPSGNMILVGHISGSDPSSNYLLNPGGGAYFQNTIAGFIDVTIAKFNTSLQPVWSTIFGGTNLDRVSEVSTDDNGNILVVCRSADPNMPTMDPGGGAFYYATQQSANNDGFIAKFDPNGVYTWGTYVGGTDSESSMTGITADASGNIYAIGYTTCTDFPTQALSGSYNQATNAGMSEVVMMRFTSGGVNEWSTYYGGSTGSESCYGRKIDVSSIANSCGVQIAFSAVTASTDFPTTDPGGGAYFESTLSGSSSNAFILIEESAGSPSTAASSIAVTQPSNCEGDPVDLDVTGGSLASGDNWVWYSGGCGSGGSVGTGASITVNPITTTTYFVRAEGPCGNSTCVSTTVTVNPTLDPSWTTPDTVCISDGAFSLDPFITGDGGGTWSGSAVSGSTFDPAGWIGNDVAVTYTVGTSPCEQSETHNIYVRDQGDPAWSGPSIYCENDAPIDLTTLVLGDAGGTWSGTGVSGTTFDPTGLSGTITLTYTVGVATCAQSSAQTIDIVPAAGDPTAATATDTICQGDTVTITATGGGAGAIYEVYDASTGGTNFGSAPLDVNPSSTTTYYVEAVSANGCVNDGGRDPITVVVTPGPSVNAGSNASICAGETITLSGSGTGSLMWSTGETTASIDVTPAVDTFYVLTADNGVCAANDTAFVTVLTPGSVDAQNDAASATPGTAELIPVAANDVGDPSTISIVSGPSNGFASVSNGVISYMANSGFTGTDIITYVICDDQCGTLCDSADVVISVGAADTVTVPTGFTPNGDGFNDVLVINGLDNYPEHELQIYNRWGDLIYSAAPYNNDWDGQSQTATFGDRVIDGTYYYVLILGPDMDPMTGYVEIKTQ